MRPTVSELLAPRHLAAGLAAAAAALSCLAPSALASHEQGGSLSARVGADGHLRGALTYIARAGCTSSGGPWTSSVQVAPPAGMAKTVTTTGTIAACDAAGTATRTGTFDVDLEAEFPGAGAGQYTVTFGSCCRVSGIANVSSTSTALEARVRRVIGAATSTPELRSRVATGVAKGYTYAQSLNGVDPVEGGAIAYSSLLVAPDFDVIDLGTAPSRSRPRGPPRSPTTRTTSTRCAPRTRRATTPSATSCSTSPPTTCRRASMG